MTNLINSNLLLNLSQPYDTIQDFVYSYTHLMYSQPLSQKFQ